MSERRTKTFAPELIKLGNGVRVLHDFMPERESVSVGVWIRAGSRYEPVRRNGLFHLLEHMLFKGTAFRSGPEISRKIEGVGGTLNGFTGEECTCYWARVTRKHLRTALDLLLEMVAHPRLKSSDLRKEKEVVKEEIKMYRDIPGQHCQQTLQSLMWPRQPLGRPVLGTGNVLDGLSREDLIRYRDKYYTPSRLSIVVCGNARPSAILPSAEALAATAKRPGTFPPAAFNRAGPRINLEQRSSAQAYFGLGWKGLPRADPRIYALKILNIILGANMSSRLFQQIREKRGWAYAIHSHLSQYVDTGSLEITAGILPDSLPACLKVIKKEILRLTRREPSRREVRRAQDYLWGQTALALEQTTERMIWRGVKLATQGVVEDPAEVHEKIKAVTPSAVSRLARRLFAGSRFCLSVLGPYQQEKSFLDRLDGILKS